MSQVGDCRRIAPGKSVLKVRVKARVRIMLVLGLSRSSRNFKRADLLN